MNNCTIHVNLPEHVHLVHHKTNNPHQIQLDLKYLCQGHRLSVFDVVVTFYWVELTKSIREN